MSCDEAPLYAFCKRESNLGDIADKVQARNNIGFTDGIVPIALGGTGVTTGLTVLSGTSITSGSVPIAQGGTGVTNGLTQLNGSNITTGIVAVAKGGTGVTASTGTGSVVLSSGSVLTGTTSIASLAVNGASTLSGKLSVFDNSFNSQPTVSIGDIAGYPFNSSANPVMLSMMKSGLGTGNFVGSQLGRNGGDSVFTTFTMGATTAQNHWGIAHYGVPPQLAVLQNGNVGIGKTDPSYKLDVNGDVRASNFFGSGASLTSLPMGQATGTLAVANGGTGVTTSTGTGSVVLSAGPVLTGTVTATGFSGSGASLTSLPMGQATGTLAAANGGTGVTTGLTVLSGTSITSGIVPVLQGGTGVTSATGTGSVVLSNNPSLAGTITGQKLTLSGFSGGTATPPLYVVASDENPGPDVNGIYVYNPIYGSRATVAIRTNGSGNSPILSLDMAGVAGATIGLNSTGDVLFKNDWNFSGTENLKIERLNGNLTARGNVIRSVPFVSGFFTPNAGSNIYINLLTKQTSGGMAVTTSNKLVAPISGVYHFGFNTIYNTNYGRQDLKIHVNGSEKLNTLNEDNGSGYHYRSASLTYYLEASDYVQFYNAGTNIFDGGTDAFFWQTFFFHHVG